MIDPSKVLVIEGNQVVQNHNQETILHYLQYETKLADDLDYVIVKQTAFEDYEVIEGKTTEKIQVFSHVDNGKNEVKNG